MFASFKRLRKTKHTHHPVDDARGKAEAMLQIKDQYDLNAYSQGAVPVMGRSGESLVR
jgi:hypothetical protein